MCHLFSSFHSPKSTAFSHKRTAGTRKMALSCARRGSDWVLWRISSQKGLSSIGTSCPGKWLNHYPWRYLKDQWMWHLGHGLVLDVAVNNAPRGVFQPKCFCGLHVIHEFLYFVVFLFSCILSKKKTYLFFLYKPYLKISFDFLWVLLQPFLRWRTGRDNCTQQAEYGTLWIYTVTNFYTLFHFPCTYSYFHILILNIYFLLWLWVSGWLFLLQLQGLTSVSIDVSFVHHLYVTTMHLICVTLKCTFPIVLWISLQLPIIFTTSIKLHCNRLSNSNYGRA